MLSPKGTCLKLTELKVTENKGYSILSIINFIQNALFEVVGIFFFTKKKLKI